MRIKVTSNREILDLIQTEPYNFLKENHYLGDNILLLSLGGSRAYGTNLPNSDWDIRGFAINPANQIFGLNKDFENIVDKNTDTTIYSLNKMIRLLTECNPNTLEILGCRPEDYIYMTEHGQKVLNNKQNFLSIIAIKKFGGYANEQYNRLEHALLGNGHNDEKTLEMLLHSLQCSIDTFNIQHKYTKANISLRILSVEEYEEYLKKLYDKKEKDAKLELSDNIKSVTEMQISVEEKASKIQSLTDKYNNAKHSRHEEYLNKLDDKYNAINERIAVTGNFTDYPIGDIQDLLRNIHKIKSEYGNINKRNTKKDSIHLCKHMMHLNRLLIMGTILNKTLEVKTYLDGEYHEMLMEIRNGKYLTEDGLRVRPEYFDMLHELQAEYKYSNKHTLLPEHPNIDALNEMLFEIYRDTYLNKKNMQ